MLFLEALKNFEQTSLTTTTVKKNYFLFFWLNSGSDLRKIEKNYLGQKNNNSKRKRMIIKMMKINHRKINQFQVN